MDAATKADVDRAQDERRRLIATIQMARKALALDDGTYRSILVRIANQNSCTLCNLEMLTAVVAEFKRLGFKPAPGRDRRPASRSAKVRLVWAIWREITPFLDAPDDAALRGFVAKQTRSAATPDGVSAPQFLTDKQCDQVIEGLKGWRENLKRARATGQ